MTCDACPRLAERHCPQCKRGFCAAHDGHTQNGSVRWCTRCTTARKMVYMEKFGDRQIGMALALAVTPQEATHLGLAQQIPLERDDPPWPEDELGQALVEVEE